MSYQEAMEAAGAEVHEYKEFGSYQGTWIADVTYRGERGYVEGSYGSCSGCDAFQGEFDYSWDHEHDNRKYYNPSYEEPLAGCPKCEEYKTKLKEFGEGYLHSIVPKEQLVSIYRKKVADDYSWEDDKEILEWLKARGI
jgi:hypothetical protein